MKCPVCKTELDNGAMNCLICGFNHIRIEFINTDEVNEWQKNTVEPYRKHWLQNCNVDIDLNSNESLMILQQFFTNENHIYTIGNLSINTKFAAFIWNNNEDGHMKFEVQKFGYEYFQLDYQAVGYEVLIFMKDKDEPNKRYDVGKITSNNTNTRRELLTVLMLMKNGSFHFDYAFDDNIKWYERKNTDNYYMMKNYFSGKKIAPFSFRAKYIEADDYNIKEPQKNYGIQDIVFSVENPNGQPWSVFDMDRGNPKHLVIKLKDKKTNSTIEQKYNLKDITFFNTRDDLYINEDTMSVFIGEQDQYQQFQFTDFVNARRAFDYLMILFSHSI